MSELDSSKESIIFLLSRVTAELQGMKLELGSIRKELRRRDTASKELADFKASVASLIGLDGEEDHSSYDY